MTIRTTHVGSLPRTDSLIDANRARRDGTMDEAAFTALLADEVDQVVKRQVDLGLSIVNDGEYGHAMIDNVDYGAWWTYSFSRFSGLSIEDVVRLDVRPPAGRDGRISFSSFAERRDWVRFADAYSDPESGIHIANKTPVAFPTVTAELTYIGTDAVERDIAGTKRALEAAGKTVDDGFVAAISPGSAARVANAFYEDDEAVVWAFAEGLHEEYKRITDAGLTVQIDAPDLAEGWDQFAVDPSLEAYRAFSRVRIDALNHALEGIDPDLVRYHVCWGSWHGPHSTDLEFKHIVDLALSVNANGLSFEAANARHAHEWEIWKDTTLPEGKYLVPGVVSHATNVIEHPRLVAQRIHHFTDLVGADRVVASTDCGLGGRIHSHIAWAKLEALTEGARLVG
ncbi:cobalamin-independent methionine synthase II family protein [Schaalia sp. 19OD2882]|uniref:cobalamin-independent methionine synthase II family protein n=1 Tax=Schaalia sp. 19OD2882 TaxID=2794089 RepID=UPI001C1EE92D|nr:cobalamin-independent methionine synthase II family protein [Schaalia sp. 19OD2882]QWW19114.1 cobalamin-independent methionine synthase II family protein [Schaalia sp. 19OD2882]